MVSFFNLTKLKQLLQDLYNLTNIQITVFNDQFEVICAYPETQCRFCQIIRSSPAGLKQCKKCDNEAINTVIKRREAYVYQCHAGLTEAIAPIFADNILIGYIYLSHIFSHASYEEGWTVIRQLCRNYDVDFAALKETCLEAPIIPEKNILSAANILNSVASYLYTSRMAYLKKENLIIQIDKYIEQHLSESINIPDICEYFQIGATHLYHLSMENYGMGIAAHIRSRRIEKAKELLAENTDLNISEIASACGFEDYNYFIALFKRTVGLSPKKYRDTCSEHGNTTLFKNFI